MDPMISSGLDFFRGGSGRGVVAQRLLAANMDVRAIRTNATLRRDEWIEIDRTVVDSSRLRLVGVQDLMSRGLQYNLSNAFGKLALEYQSESDMHEAQISMSGLNRADNDRVEFATQSMPIPLYHKDFQMDSRHLAASRNGGESLDTIQARVSARKVAELAETVLFQGAGALGWGGTALYGYTDFPQRVTMALGTAWTDVGVTGEEILQQVMDMVAESLAVKHRGPWVLYVPAAWQLKLGADYKANGDKTIRQRVLEIEGLEAVTVSDFLPADNAVLVEMVPETVQIVNGMQPTTVEWEQEGGFLLNFKVLAIMPPRIRFDHDGNSGIVHLS